MSSCAYIVSPWKVGVGYTALALIRFFVEYITNMEYKLIWLACYVMARVGVGTAGNRLFKSTKNDYKNELNMFTCFGLFFEILNLLKIIYFNSDKM